MCKGLAIKIAVVALALDFGMLVYVYQIVNCALDIFEHTPNQHLLLTSAARKAWSNC